MTESQQLLAEYVENGSETAFRELVARYLDFVYSAAVRLTCGDSQLAEDISQTVFVHLARKARSLPRQVLLGGWLHQDTCFVAATVMRGERRRQSRERQAVEMNALNDSSEASLARIAPLLDEAINELGSEDRTAILLRFFEQHDFRSIGAALGSNEDAARMRVNRALEKLHVLLKQRGATSSAAVLALALTGTTVMAAPPGLAVSISSAALAGAAAGGGSALTLLKVMTMTKLKLGILSAILVAGVVSPLVIQHQTKLRRENEDLRQQMDQLTAENARLSNQVAQASQAAESARQDELAASLKTNAAPSQASPAGAGAPTTASGGGSARQTNDTSVLAGMIVDPQVRKLIRDQQKAGMNVIYKSLAKQLNLTPEQTDHLNDVLADSVMDNLDQITKVLRDGKTSEQMTQVFADQDAALQEKLKAELGADGYAQYQDYTHNLLSSLTTDQFKATLPADKPLSAEQSTQLYQVLLEETQSALARAGLDSNYQAVPILNFRNIASEDAMNASLNLLDEIYNNAYTRASGFLTPDELAKFAEFRTNAMNVSRVSIVMNRKMMAPAAQ